METLSLNEIQNYKNNDDIEIVLTGGPMAPESRVVIKEVPIKSIKLAKNSRLNISDDEISGLMQSIKKTGLLQPIGVFKSKTNTGYEICYGNRRFLACSKLGMSKVPAIIHVNKTDAENDLKNLTENLQRRNISLTEAGRYIEILKNDNLSLAEIAVRLGVSVNYVKDCLTAFQKVPKEFRKDLDVRTTMDKKRVPGKISINSARSIVSATATYRLDAEQEKILYNAAKSKDKFNYKNIEKYAAAVKSGSQNPVEDVPHLKHMNVQFWLSEDDAETLYKKHIVKGPFKSLNGLFVAILKGEKSERIKIYSGT